MKGLLLLWRRKRQRDYLQQAIRDAHRRKREWLADPFPFVYRGKVDESQTIRGRLK